MKNRSEGRGRRRRQSISKRGRKKKKIKNGKVISIVSKGRMTPLLYSYNIPPPPPTPPFTPHTPPPPPHTPTGGPPPHTPPPHTPHLPHLYTHLHPTPDWATPGCYAGAARATRRAGGGRCQQAVAWALLGLGAGGRANACITLAVVVATNATGLLGCQLALNAGRGRIRMTTLHDAVTRGGPWLFMLEPFFLPYSPRWRDATLTTLAVSSCRSLDTIRRSSPPPQPNSAVSPPNLYYSLICDSSVRLVRKTYGSRTIFANRLFFSRMILRRGRQLRSNNIAAPSPT